MFAPADGYSVDTSAWIYLSKVYPVDVFGSLWDRLEKLIGGQGRIRSPGQVLEELRVGADALYLWAKKRESTLIVPEDPDTLRLSTQILAACPLLVDANSTIPEADPFVIALAEKNHWTVVTMEKFSQPGSKKEHIPNVCAKRKVPCADLLGLFRAESWKV
ncbi:MAG: DUF4411 family protein [Thermoplasmata archaeon]|nr:DUF4411 family protein [Thermoplasmata archaeon]